MRAHVGWTIGRRLMASFLLVSAITALLGGVGYYAVSNGGQAINELGQVRLPSVGSLLILSQAQTTIEGAENALLSRDIDAKARQEKYDLIASAWQQAEQAWSVYEPLPRTNDEDAVWSEFVPAWRQWKQDHESFLKLSHEFDATGVQDPAALQRDLFEVRGTYWKTLASLAKQVKEGVELAETDTVNTLLAESVEDWTKKISSPSPAIT